MGHHALYVACPSLPHGGSNRRPVTDQNWRGDAVHQVRRKLNQEEGRDIFDTYKLLTPTYDCLEIETPSHPFQPVKKIYLVWTSSEKTTPSTPSSLVEEWHQSRPTHQRRPPCRTTLIVSSPPTLSSRISFGTAVVSPSLSSSGSYGIDQIQHHDEDARAREYCQCVDEG